MVCAGIMAPAAGYRIPLGNQEWSDECFANAIRIEGEFAALDDESRDLCVLRLFEGF